MIDEKLIFTEFECTEKTSLLNFCYKQLKKLEYLSDISEFENEIKAREEIMPTSVGFGVAIPHGRCKLLNDHSSYSLELVSHFFGIKMMRRSLI